MDSLQQMNLALDYIEEHLADEIDFREVARLAVCSEYHFSRMFSFLTGVTLSEYIRRRRLTLAAFELQNGATRVIDVALKYGYSSPDSFARAFQGLHGISPSAAKDDGHRLKSYSRMTFQLAIRGGIEMNYRIEQRAPFRIVGIMRRVPIVFTGVNQAIAAMWSELGEERIVQLKALSDLQPSGLLQASVNFSEGRMQEQGELDHYIGVATSQQCPPGLSELQVSASTWAVFTAVGPFPETLQNTWGRIYSEWFPSSGYQLAVGPEMLWNEHKDVASPTFRSEIWIPVEKKA